MRRLIGACFLVAASLVQATTPSSGNHVDGFVCSEIDGEIHAYFDTEGMTGKPVACPPQYPDTHKQPGGTSTQ